MIFISVGVLHFTHPETFVAMMPDYLGHHAFWVSLTGVAELAGGLGLLIPAVRRWAGFGVLALLVAVFPANLHMAIHQITPPGLTPVPWWVLWARLPIQPLAMLGVWWVALAKDLPPPRRDLAETDGWSLVFFRQDVHFAALGVLLVMALHWPGPGPMAGEWLGFSAQAWFRSSVFVAVAHQMYVWWFWRHQLAFGSIGAGNGFLAFRVGFLPLLFARPLLMVGVGLADWGSLYTPSSASWGLAAVLFAVSAWTMASVGRFFGVTRATGADHFDEAYRSIPLVEKGAFAVVSNAMYVLGFLGLWAVAVASGSWAAFTLAAFSQAYIGVHYFCTEKPDMDWIYSD